MPAAEPEVVIVGAGPVGMLLACCLAAGGIDVVVCEQRRHSSERGRAIGIHSPGLDALAHVGLSGPIRAEALRLDGGDVLCAGRTLARIDFAAEHPVHTIAQERIDALLRDRLDVLAPGALRRGCHVRRVDDGADGMRVTTDSGPDLHARLVIAADGVHSDLRRAAGIPWLRRPGAADYVMVDVDDPDTDARALLHLEPAGLVESFPLPGGRRRWVVRDTPDDPIRTIPRLRQEIAARTGRAPVIPDASELSPFHARQHTAGRLVRRRLVLLGDAAHETSPIGGQGMNLGWVNAQRLAAAILHAHRAGGETLPVQLSRWEREARRSAARAQRRAGFYMAMGQPVPDAALPLRTLIVRGLGSRMFRARTLGAITMRHV